ncbi:hypothetical protein [Carnobacterium inhibens]|uniref:Lipoprotein n=1 Tax=Carnobacterium inhibens subsp. gilichinskyi TaxID=1266845 RepID=U5SC80_9LACT|nr:hypothetical protein [Carnobacterium inhibens]AGY82855.1 hypothetical protein Q783_08350 [Carnobacterium inhibens subsp. gilichinskyi]
MNKIKLLTTIGICGFILAACGTEETSVNDSNTAEVAKSESIAVEESGLDELDQSTTDELAKIGSEDEEIDWEKINLNKRQFKEYIESLDEQEETSEETLTIVSSSMPDDTTIEIIINNPDTSEMRELTNGFFTIMMDSFSRQLYLSSDYSDGSTQPTILIKDDTGNIISEETDFIEMEETE